MSIARHARSVGASTLIIALTACASTPEPRIGPTVTAPVTEFGQAEFQSARPTEYQLRTADVLSVIVFREPNLSNPNVRISLDGNISLPMLGTIPVNGATTAELESDIERRLSAAGLKSPKVSVNITEYASHLVTVEGAVRTPGVYTFQPGARLSAAIALAQGPTRVAKLDQVAVFREAETGLTIAKFDYGQVNQGLMLDPVLQPGDRVYVGTSGLSQFWQDTLRALPAFGVFAALP